MTCSRVPLLSSHTNDSLQELFCIRFMYERFKFKQEDYETKQNESDYGTALQPQAIILIGRQRALKSHVELHHGLVTIQARAQ